MILYSFLAIVLSILSISITSFFVNSNNEVNATYRLPIFIHSMLMLGFPIHYLFFNDVVTFQSLYGLVFFTLIVAVLHIILYFLMVFSKFLRMIQLGAICFYVLFLTTLSMSYFYGLFYDYSSLISSYVPVILALFYLILAMAIFNVKQDQPKYIRQVVLSKILLCSLIFSLSILLATTVLSRIFDYAVFIDLILVSFSFLVAFIALSYSFFSELRVLYRYQLFDQIVFYSLFTILFVVLIECKQLIFTWVELPILGLLILLSSILYFLFPIITDFKEKIMNRFVSELFSIEDKFTEFTFHFSNILHLKQISSQLVNYMSKALSSNTVQLFSFSGYLVGDISEELNTFLTENRIDFLSFFDEFSYYDRSLVDLSSFGRVNCPENWVCCKSFFDKQDIELIMPVKIHGNYLIFLILYSRPSHSYTFNEKVFLNMVSHYLSAVFQNAIYYQKLMFNKDLMELTNEFALALNELMTTTDLYTIWAKYLNAIFSSKLGIVYEKNRSNNQWETTYASKSFFSDFSKADLDSVFPFQNKVPIVYESGYQLYRDSTELIDEHLMATLFEHSGTRTALLFYLADQNGCYAVICTFFKSDTNVFPISQYLIVETVLQLLQVSYANFHTYDELRDTKVYNELILEQLITPVLLLDKSFNITGINRSGEKLLNTSLWNLIHKPVTSLIDSLPEFQLIVDSLESGESRNIEFKLNRDKQVYIYAVSIASIDSGIVLVFTDVSDQRLLEQQVNHVSHQSSLGTLAAGVAHEIKNPLVAIRTFTQLLTKKYKTDGFKDRYMSIVPPQIDRIASLCDSLVQLGKPLKPNRNNICFLTLMERVFVLGKLVASDKRKLIHVESSVDFELFVDKDQFEQVILNLLLNAIDSLKEVDNPAISISTSHVSEDYSELVIQDNGCGIELDRIQHLFDPFYTTKVTGTGLGMSVVHQIIKAHDGDISVISKVGSGSTFKIVIPRESSLYS